MMEIYLVGGAVRDKLLGRPVSERDWLVLGAAPQELQARGFQAVGKDFTVFLHPRSKEQYALARGAQGLGSSRALLREDLRRRDLTINAIAETADGRLIDPFDGRRDLEQRRLRHVSPAFRDDPVRVLRVARFAARYSDLGFSVAPETITLMRDMAHAGDLDRLVPERVWSELVRALGEDYPAQFFAVLRECGALGRILPEIDRLYGVPQPPKPHPEVDTGVHTMLALQQAVRLSPAPEVRFAVLTHDVGKGLTPRARWPRHIAHEHRGAQLIEQLCQRLRAPSRYRDLAVLTARYHTRCHRAVELRPATLLDTLLALDALRRPQRFEQFLVACEADARGRKGLATTPYPQACRLRQARAVAAAVEAAPLLAQGLTGPALSDALRQRRIDAIRGI